MVLRSGRWLQTARMKCRSDGDSIARPSREAGMGIELLLLAVGVYAAIWLAVLVGSQFFGPR